jgi:hypothetical protein
MVKATNQWGFDGDYGGRVSEDIKNRFFDGNSRPQFRFETTDTRN